MSNLVPATGKKFNPLHISEELRIRLKEHDLEIKDTVIPISDELRGLGVPSLPNMYWIQCAGIYDLGDVLPPSAIVLHDGQDGLSFVQSAEELKIDNDEIYWGRTDDYSYEQHQHEINEQLIEIFSR